MVDRAIGSKPQGISESWVSCALGKNAEKSKASRRANTERRNLKKKNAGVTYSTIVMGHIVACFVCFVAGSLLQEVQVSKPQRRLYLLNQLKPLYWWWIASTGLASQYHAVQFPHLSAVLAHWKALKRVLPCFNAACVYLRVV